MKILHLCTKVPLPSNDGGSLAVMAFAFTMKKAGHQVTVLAANTPKHFQANVPSVYNGIRILAISLNTNIKWYKVLTNLLFSKLPYNVSRFGSQYFAEAVKELLQSETFDIIQLEGPHLGVYLPVIWQNSTAKVVLRAHNVEHLLWNEIKNSTTSLLKRLYLGMMAARLKKFETGLIAEVDGVLAISENDKQIILEVAVPKAIDVVPFGGIIPPDAQKKSPLENSLFFIGALDWLPNQSGLCWFLDRVWPVLLHKLPQITFHIAGRNASKALQSRLCAEKVYFYGEVPNAKVFMEKYQIQIVPLFAGSGVRVKILEGMALGVPIVATSKAAEGISVADGTHLLVADNREAFIEKIIELVRDKSKRNFIGENARAFISKEFDNFALSERIESFYQRLAGLRL